MLKDKVARLNERRIRAYSECPADISEHFGIEQTVLAGGYGYRQILELVQNGADAILEAREAGEPSTDSDRIHVLLRDSRLYVANTGAPLSEQGVEALLGSHSSPKRGNQIGRFGLGFKSLLQLDGKIDLFTRKSGAVRFDPQRCREELKERFGKPEAPSLRLAWALDETERTDDDTLAQLSWAETIVRVEIQATERLGHLRREVAGFPAEFLLFFPFAISIALDDGAESRRELRVAADGDNHELHDGADVSRWRVATRAVTITDARAIKDATHIHYRGSVPLAWAFPLEGKHEEAGRFWAFFPTDTPTRLSGILNAPWKLNSDRNAIIRGEWNTSLMREAACLVVETLQSLSTAEDPGRALDAFPRQVERAEAAAPVVEAIWTALETAAVIPDVSGNLRTARELWRHPLDDAELAAQWQAIEDPVGLCRLVHFSCLKKQRGNRLNVLADRLKAKAEEQSPCPGLQRYDAASWFSAVASTEVPIAVNLLKLVEAFRNGCKQGEWSAIRPALAIIPSEVGQLLRPDQAVFAPVGVDVPNRRPVASGLCDDADAKRILSDVMKVRALDDALWESVLHEALPPHPRSSWEVPSDEKWQSFWAALGAAPQTVRQSFITRNRDRIRVHRRDGRWVFSARRSAARRVDWTR